jgi:hypothetical protein
VSEPFVNLTSNQVMILTFAIMGLTVILVLWADRITDRASAKKDSGPSKRKAGS